MGDHSSAWIEAVRESWSYWLLIIASYALALWTLKLRLSHAGMDARHSWRARLATLALPSLGAALWAQVVTTQRMRDSLLTSLADASSTAPHDAMLDAPFLIAHAACLLVWSLCCLYALRQLLRARGGISWSDWLLGACGWFALVTSASLICAESAFGPAQPELFGCLRWIVSAASLAPLLAALPLLRSERLPRQADVKTLATCLGLAAIALASFLATRPLASDAAQPLPVHAPRASACTCDPQYFTCDPAGAARYPRITRNVGPTPPDYGVDLMFHSNGTVTLYNTSIGARAAIDRDAVRAALETVKQRWAKLHSSERFPDQLVVRASASTPVAQLLPALESAADSGMRGFVICGAETIKSSETRTAGTIKRVEQHALTASFSPNGVPVAGLATWSDLASIAATGEQQFSLANPADH